MKKSKTKKVKLTVPMPIFYRDYLPIGTICEIVGEDDDRYLVRFPGKIGYSGAFGVKKSHVKEVL